MARTHHSVAWQGRNPGDNVRRIGTTATIPPRLSGTAANVPTAGSMPQQLQPMLELHAADQRFWTRCKKHEGLLPHLATLRGFSASP
ncbi:hypothetical protein O1611_g3726 [Lasiodiplodia mahajangana]|uniref:Uncharacterized protein n=1 Tax=Lasiodiplodia mahajangana TaxID=1108764 RepID=A0ACC2JRD1_9PEZI|nr:hypothetical protein O1611_g3726 [Lasiodiplodia mahajangana]